MEGVVKENNGCVYIYIGGVGPFDLHGLATLASISFYICMCMVLVS
jgi:hypothetical protein